MIDVSPAVRPKHAQKDAPDTLSEDTKRVGDDDPHRSYTPLPPVFTFAASGTFDGRGYPYCPYP